LPELIDELDIVIVLILARVVGVECDSFKLFNGVDFVFTSRTPYQVAHGVERFGVLIPLIWFLNHRQL
jgi:hypothetical protein